jgi:hypothetical protein
MRLILKDYHERSCIDRSSSNRKHLVALRKFLLHTLAYPGFPSFQKGITIYAREGPTFAVIAGLLLDTKPWDNSSNRWAPAGKPRIVCHADSKQTIRLGCDALLS